MLEFFKRLKRSRFGTVKMYSVEDAVEIYGKEVMTRALVTLCSPSRFPMTGDELSRIAGDAHRHIAMRTAMQRNMERIYGYRTAQPQPQPIPAPDWPVSTPVPSGPIEWEPTVQNQDDCIVIR